MITRTVDALGRIVLPVEFRMTLNIRDGSKMDMAVENGTIVLKPSSFEHTCSICGKEAREELLPLYDARICSECAAQIAQAATQE